MLHHLTSKRKIWPSLKNQHSKLCSIFLLPEQWSVIYINIQLPHPSSRIHSDFGHESSFIKCQLLENCQIVFCTLHYFILDLNQILKVYETEAYKMLLKYLFALSSTKGQHLNWSNLVFLQKLQDHLEFNFRNTKDFWLQLQYFHKKIMFKY